MLASAIVVSCTPDAKESANFPIEAMIQAQGSTAKSEEAAQSKSGWFRDSVRIHKLETVWITQLFQGCKRRALDLQ
jgi:hypothetical protein